LVKDRRNLGECLILLGLLHARAGRPDEAARCLDESEPLVRNGPDRTLLGMLFCARAEAQHLVGNADAAAQWLDDAAAEAVACEATPGSEFGIALARLKAMLATA
jgi:ATP/maltotriose-dependent transcriptional regulator MalT